MNLTGKWEGFYEYGYGYNIDYFGQRVNVKISLEDGNDGVDGTCEEDKSKYAVDLQATIKGFYEENLISFIKTYPKNPVVHENGEKTMEEGILEIEHVGEINESGDKMFGKWTIYSEFIDEEGYTHEYSSEGIWFLERMNENG